MEKERLPSPAQARKLAELWASRNQELSKMIQGPIHSSGPYNDATTLALIKYGWVSTTDTTKSFANGTTWEIYKISDRGIDAIENFFRETRYRRQKAAA